MSSQAVGAESDEDRVDTFQISIATNICFEGNLEYFSGPKGLKNSLSLLIS